MEIAVLALGCFWGPEIKFSKIPGIIKTEVGYCGGSKPKVTYKEVCTGETNHAEVVKLNFDENQISYEEIINKLKTGINGVDRTQKNLLIVGPSISYLPYQTLFHSAIGEFSKEIKYFSYKV